MRKTKTASQNVKKAGFGTVFGTSTDRQLYPHDTPHTRLGNQIVPCRTHWPLLGPGCYNVTKTNIISDYVSNKGFSSR